MKQKKMNGKTLLCVLLVLAQLLLLTIPAVADGTTTPTEVVGLNETASLFGNEFRFFLPDGNDTNLFAKDAEYSFTTPDDAKALDEIEFAETVDISDNQVAFIAYKLKNTGDVAVSVGTRLHFYCKVTRQAGAGLPLAYDATTGEKLDYSVDPARKQSSTLRVIEIPAGKEVFLVVPFTSTDSETKYVPTLNSASNGNITMEKDSDGTTKIETNYNSATGGYINLTKMSVYCMPSTTTETGTFEVSDCYAMSMSRYTERYNEFNFNMLEGASVRLGTPTGLRFEATVDSNDWDYLVNRYGAENVTMGTIITPSTNATTDEQMTFASLDANATTTTKYLNVTAGAFYKKVGDDFVIAGSIANISENNYTKNYVGRAYIKVVDGDSTFYLYATGAQSRNISYIASQALLDTKPAEDKENGYIYQLDENKWSCYDPETEIPILEGFVVSQGQ